MYCVRPLLKWCSKEAAPKHLLGAGHSGPASLGCLWGCRKPAPITGMLPCATDVWCPWSQLNGFPDVGGQAWKCHNVLLHSQWWLGKPEADTAASAVLPGPGSQLQKLAFLHRGAGLNDPRWGIVFAGWMVSAWMYVYLAFGICMHVYVSTYIQVKAYVKAENSLKIQT